MTVALQLRYQRHFLEYGRGQKGCPVKKYDMVTIRLNIVAIPILSCLILRPLPLQSRFRRLGCGIVCKDDPCSHVAVRTSKQGWGIMIL